MVLCLSFCTTNKHEIWVSMPIINRIADYFDEMQAWRHHMHSHPELGFDCFETAKFVKTKLEQFGVDKIYTEIARTGIVAIISGKSTGKTLD